MKKSLLGLGILILSGCSATVTIDKEEIKNVEKNEEHTYKIKDNDIVIAEITSFTDLNCKESGIVKNGQTKLNCQQYQKIEIKNLKTTENLDCSILIKDKKTGKNNWKGYYSLNTSESIKKTIKLKSDSDTQIICE